MKATLASLAKRKRPRHRLDASVDGDCCGAVRSRRLWDDEAVDGHGWGAWAPRLRDDAALPCWGAVGADRSQHHAADGDTGKLSGAEHRSWDEAVPETGLEGHRGSSRDDKTRRSGLRDDAAAGAAVGEAAERSRNVLPWTRLGGSEPLRDIAGRRWRGRGRGPWGCVEGDVAVDSEFYILIPYA